MHLLRRVLGRYIPTLFMDIRFTAVKFAYDSLYLWFFPAVICPSSNESLFATGIYALLICCQICL
jgi:hypothetical protein